MTRLVLLFLLVIALSFTGAARAEEMTAVKMMAFADSLFAKGDYYRAITEYERVIFYAPGDPLEKQARFQIANCYFKGDRLDQALERFRELNREYANEETGRKAYFMIGEVYYQKRDYARAFDVFTMFTESYPEDRQSDEARIRTGWAQLRQGMWQQAQESFRKLPSGSPLNEQATGLAVEAQHYADIPMKSPSLAGGLSAVLPGAGQLYVNRPGDALVSFLLNGAFIWATVEAFHNDNNVTGGILLFFESGWYLGNIYNAVGGAHKYNRRSEKQYMDKLEDKYRVSYLYDKHGGSMLALTMRF